MYKSNTSVESLLDAMNTFFEMKNLDDIKDAQFLTIMPIRWKIRHIEKHLLYFQLIFQKQWND